jgi:phosphoglycolate phosphatase
VVRLPAPLPGHQWAGLRGVPRGDGGLARLREAGLRLACLTNKPTAFAKPLLQAKGLDGFFSHVFGGDAFERTKPDPLPLLRTCEALGSTPAFTLMVGIPATTPARAAGCPVVLMAYGYNHGEPPESAHPDAVLARLDALDLRALRPHGG